MSRLFYSILTACSLSLSGTSSIASGTTSEFGFAELDALNGKFTHLHSHIERDRIQAALVM